jgi:NADH pyrophosphatase NudC (nudix superfamily)
MHWQRCHWIHTNADYPVVLYSEINANGWEIRKVDLFPDAHFEYAGAGHETERTVLSTEPMPPISTINADPQFIAAEITEHDFNVIWSAAVRLAAGPQRPLCCPRCGDPMHLTARRAGDTPLLEFRCPRGGEYSANLTDLLIGIYLTHTADAGRRPGRWGGSWFCPACGVATEHHDGGVVCPRCGIALDSLMFYLIELSPHPRL